MSAKEPNTSAKEPKIPVRETYVSAKEPHIFAKEPHISAKEPRMSAKEPYFIRGYRSCVVLEKERRKRLFCRHVGLFVDMCGSFADM